MTFEEFLFKWSHLLPRNMVEEFRADIAKLMAPPEVPKEEEAKSEQP